MAIKSSVVSISTNLLYMIYIKDELITPMSKKTILTIIINCIIAINVTIVALLGIICGAGDGQLGNYVIGLGYLKPYTMDSNILAGVIALLVVIFSIKGIKNGRRQMPRWLMNAYLMGTTCLDLTFLIATAFLAPMEVAAGRNYFIMFSKDMFFFHFLNPLLATITLVILLEEYSFSFVDRIIGMAPTIVYSIIYFVMLVVLKQWEDFYNFTFGGKYYLIPIVVAIIYGITVAVSWVLAYMHNRFK